MDLAALIPLVLKISLGVVVFSLGLNASIGDVTQLLRRPSLLVRSILSMNVVMPLIAVAVAKVFSLRPTVELALIVLSVSPVPPILPGKQSKAGGKASYAIGLLVIAAALAIVVVPASIAIIARLFGREIAVPTSAIAMLVATSVLAPLVLGMIVRRVAPGVAGAAPLLSKIGMVLLLLAFIPILVKFWPAIAAQVGDFTILAIVLFTLVALAVGHLLGGPDPDERAVLALATASRHPGVAIAIAGAATAVIAPEEKGAAAATVLLAVLVGAVVTTLYVKWRKKSRAGTVAAEPG